MPEPTPAGGPPTPPPVDRRAFPRRKPRGSAIIRLSEKALAPDVRVTLKCISQGGAAFIVGKQLAVDQHIIVVLQSTAASMPLITVKASVRWIVPEKQPNQFRVGVAFIDRLSYGQLIQLS